MKSLFRFIVRFHFFIAFLLIESFSLFLLINYNKQQKETFVNSANIISGIIFNNVNQLTSYINLQESNKILVEENAKLRNKLLHSFKERTDTLKKIQEDTIKYFQQYEYKDAKVIKNSVNKRNNHITINKGRNHGVLPDMGVITSEGIVGIVKNVSDNFASVISILNVRLSISAKIKKNNYFGSLYWDGKNHQTLILKEIPNHANVLIGDTIISSGYSNIFPEGIEIGTIENIKDDKSGNFYILKIKTATNLKQLSHVYVVSNLLKKEQIKLETTNND